MATILVVDDISANRQLLTTILTAQGHQLLEAADGREALATIQAGHPDLLITDVLMPLMDGYELGRHLRLDPVTSRIPIVFYTAHYGEREAREFALSSGVSYVLTKPAQIADVLRIVGLALSGESETAVPPGPAPLTTAFDREHLRLVTDQQSEQAEYVRAANARLRALINIGLELAAERDPDRLLQRVCLAARDLFGSTYVTLGIVDIANRTMQRLFMCGADATDWIKRGDAPSGILATVVAEGRTMRGDNPGGDPTRLQLPPFHPRVNAFLAAPIASPAHVYGWICFVNNEGRTFSDEDEDLAMALAGQVGRICENRYFYAIAQRRAEALEHEILERQQAECAVRQERDRAQRYLDTAEVILLALDVAGRITLVNRYACSVLGSTKEELLGRDWVETCLPDRIREGSRQKFHNLVSGDLSGNEDPVLARSGQERLIEWRNTLLRGDSGQVIGTFSSGTDITERHQAVESLRTAEERMRFALEAADVGIWDMDYATGVLKWSETLESQYGLQPGTFGGTLEAFMACVHPQDRAALAETMAKAKRDGSDFSLQHRTIWPDGSVRWLSGAGRVHLDVNGEPVRAVGITEDVTERRTLEAQYQQAQKMEAVGRLAGGVAHDFNNLLTVILGHCELLLGDLHPNDPLGPDIAEIQKAGAKAAGLTRQLLAFSRKQIIEPTRLDLNLVLDNMGTMLERLIGEDVKIVLLLRPGLAAIKADRGQVEQVVMNLAVNARDAMPKGGTLTIETANVDLDENYPKAHLAATPGPYVVVTFTDTGTGMTPEVQTRLFEPFFTTKEAGKGTGLGLATVHSIVVRSGGTVNVHSEVGKGTSFKVYFPRAAAAVTVTGEQPAVVRPRIEGQTVLVTEDAHALRELTKRLLERQGYKVLVAANEEEALRLFERNPSIDVLLTDVVMPNTSGPELARRLVERRPALQVVYMSGYTEDAIVQHGVLAPGIAFLHKPFTAEALGSKIRQVLDR